jgi:hypothetical protein
MAQLNGKFIQDDSIKGTKVKLDNAQALRARNAADSADIDVIQVNASDEIILASLPKVGADDLESTSNKGQANGYASLDGSGLVPSSQLPSFVDDVEEYADLASFPGTGETGKIYVALDTEKTYRWSGSAYVEISTGPADTDALAEGSTNLYFTEQRVQDTVLSDFVVGTNTDVVNTDSLVDAIGKLQAQLDNVGGAVASVQPQESFSLTATDITNQYITLSQAPSEIVYFQIEGVVQEEGVDFEVDTTNTDRINFLGDVATLAASGDKVLVSYTA